MSNWDEYRTAYFVAREGTVSGAAAALGVHHATIIRHIDALEDRLGTKLFQRHARGYTPTEAGIDLAQIAKTTDEQLGQLEGRLKGRGSEVSGELVVTSLEGMSGLIVPVLASFREAHPELMVRYLTSDRVFRLEYGEAHVAIRAGNAPQEPDNVVQKFRQAHIGLYASDRYIERMGMPKSEDDLVNHDFVGTENQASTAPFYRWLAEKVAPERTVFRASESRAVKDAVLAGVGLGFVARWIARSNPCLVEVMESKSEWNAPFWLVTHMDLHRTAKVQAFLAHLKEEAKLWDL